MFYKAKQFNYLFGEKREGWMEAGDKGHDSGSGKETFAFFQPSDFFFHFIFTDLEISKGPKFSFNLLYKM